MSVDGYQLMYEREVPIELRSATSPDIPTEVSACVCQWLLRFGEVPGSALCSQETMPAGSVPAPQPLPAAHACAVQVGALEAIRVKVLVRGDPNRVESIKVCVWGGRAVALLMCDLTGTPPLFVSIINHQHL